MPKITKSLNQPSSPTLLSGVSTFVPSGGDHSGLEKLGKNIQDIGEDLLRKEKQARTVTYVANSTVSATEASIGIEEELRNSLRETPETYSTQFTSRMSEVHQDLIAKAPTQEAANQLTNHFASKEIGIRLSSLKRQQGAVSDKLYTEGKNNITVLENRVFDRPEEFATIMEQRNQTVLASRAYLSPEEVEKFDKVSNKVLVEGYLKGLIQKDPSRATEVLDSDAFDGILSVNEKLKYSNAVEAETLKREQTNKKLESARRESITLDREVGIHLGEVAQIDLDNDLDADRYGKKEWLNLSKKLDTELAKQKSVTLSIEDIDKRQATGTPIDLTNKKNHKSLDNYFEGVIIPTITKENQSEKVGAFIDKFNYIPTKVKSSLLAGLHNGSDKQISESALMVAAITSEYPVLARQFNSSRDLVRASQIASSVNAGMDIEDAVKAADNLLVEKNTTEHKERLKNWKETSPEFDQGEFTSLFVDDPEEVPNAMSREWNILYKDYAVNLKMEDELARNEAYKVVKSEWDITSVNTGDPQYMKYAPEVYYNKRGLDPVWIQKQLKSDIVSIDESIEDYALVVDPNTEGTEAPEYRIQYLNDRGITLFLQDKDGDTLLWRPDIEASDNVKKQLNESAESFKKKREKNLIEQEGIDITGGVF